MYIITGMTDSVSAQLPATKFHTSVVTHDPPNQSAESAIMLGLRDQSAAETSWEKDLLPMVFAALFFLKIFTGADLVSRDMDRQ